MKQCQNIVKVACTKYSGYSEIRVARVGFMGWPLESVGLWQERTAQKDGRGQVFQVGCHEQQPGDGIVWGKVRQGTGEEYRQTQLEGQRGCSIPAVRSGLCEVMSSLPTPTLGILDAAYDSRAVYLEINLTWL